MNNRVIVWGQGVSTEISRPCWFYKQKLYLHIRVCYYPYFSRCWVGTDHICWPNIPRPNEDLTSATSHNSSQKHFALKPRDYETGISIMQLSLTSDFNFCCDPLVLCKIVVCPVALNSSLIGLYI